MATFHRVIPGLYDPGLARLPWAPAPAARAGTRGEVAANGVNSNRSKHTRGVIGMARSMNPNSAGSQFFIMRATHPTWTASHAAFGKVVAGMDVDRSPLCAPTGTTSPPPRSR